MKFAGFNSAKAWKQKIHDIPYGVAEDVWNVSSFTVESGMADLKPTTYSFEISEYNARPPVPSRARAFRGQSLIFPD